MRFFFFQKHVIESLCFEYFPPLFVYTKHYFLIFLRKQKKYTIIHNDYLYSKSNKIQKRYIIKEIIFEFWIKFSLHEREEPLLFLSKQILSSESASSSIKNTLN